MSGHYHGAYMLLLSEHIVHFLDSNLGVSFDCMRGASLADASIQLDLDEMPVLHASCIAGLVLFSARVVLLMIIT